MTDIQNNRKAQSQAGLKIPAIVKPPKVDSFNAKDEAIFNLGNRVEKIEEILNKKKKGEFWTGILYTVISAIVGAIVGILITNALS